MNQSFSSPFEWLREQAPLSIDGQNGSKDLFSVCCRLIESGLSVDDGIRAILDHYNPRLLAIGTTAWNQSEVRHKMEDASRKTTAQGAKCQWRTENSGPSPAVVPDHLSRNDVSDEEFQRGSALALQLANDPSAVAGLQSKFSFRTETLTFLRDQGMLGVQPHRRDLPRIVWPGTWQDESPKDFQGAKRYSAKGRTFQGFLRVKLGTGAPKRILLVAGWKDFVAAVDAFYQVDSDASQVDILILGCDTEANSERYQQWLAHLRDEVGPVPLSILFDDDQTGSSASEGLAMHAQELGFDANAITWDDLICKLEIEGIPAKWVRGGGFDLYDLHRTIGNPDRMRSILDLVNSASSFSLDAMAVRQVLKSFVDKLLPIDLVGYAERELDRTRCSNGEGEEIPLRQKDSVLVVVHYFLQELDRAGSGIVWMNGCYWLFDSKSWRFADESDLQRFLGLTAERIGVQKMNAMHHRFQDELKKQLRVTVECPVPESTPNFRILINLENGTLTLGGGAKALRAFRKRDYFTYRLPFAYDPQASCQTFQRFLDRVLPDEECQRLLAEFLGWIFLKDLKLEKMLVLLGTGNNGKSVVFDVIRALLGPQNLTCYSLRTLANPDRRSGLADKLLNFGSEMSGIVDQELLKRMSSGEPIEARRLFGDAFIMHNYARLAFNANGLPANVEHTTGYFRRFLPIPFEAIISDEERDPDLARKIIASELPGVFNWILDGLDRVRTQRAFSACKASERALQIYQAQSDSVAQFLEDGGYHSDPDGRFPKGDLYPLYRSYCDESGLKPLSKRSFGIRLKTTHRIDEFKSNDTLYWKIVRRTEIDLC